MSLKRLADKVVLITGANEGIGLQTARVLALKDWKVLIADKYDLKYNKEKIIKETKNEKIVDKYLDLASLDSVRNLAEDIIKNEKHLDILINNAGIFTSKKLKSEDNLDYVMQVNHFGPFLLTHLLADLLKASSPSRIIFLTSIGAFFHSLTPENLNDPPSIPLMSPTLTYYNSKLCNMIAAKGFAAKLKDFNVTSNCLHPGMTSTGFLLREMNLMKVLSPVATTLLKLLTQDVEKSAKMPVFLATDNSVEGITGKFFVNFQIHNQPRVLDDEDFCERIWDETENLVGIRDDEKNRSGQNQEKIRDMKINLD